MAMRQTHSHYFLFTFLGNLGKIGIEHLEGRKWKNRSFKQETTMIKIDEAALEKAELLSKLKIEPSERKRTMKEMEKLLAYAEKLNELDTEGVEPLSHGVWSETAFREDVVTNPDGKDALLFGAPKQKDGQIVVPKTV